MSSSDELGMCCAGKGCSLRGGESTVVLVGGESGESLDVVTEPTELGHMALFCIFFMVSRC